jgi:hypothetical protein
MKKTISTRWNNSKETERQARLWTLAQALLTRDLGDLDNRMSNNNNGNNIKRQQSPPRNRD